MKAAYLSGGEEVTLIQKIDQGFLVRRLFEAEDYEGDVQIVEGGLEIVHAVYEKPPVAMMENELRDRRNELAELDRRIDERTVFFDQQESAGLQRMKKLTKHAKLKRLEDFIDGKITHLVLEGYGWWEILTVEEAGCQYEKRKLRLLSLLGDSKGDIEWRLGQYSDGSGSSAECTPCTSYEEARELVQAAINRGVEAGQEYKRSRFVDVAEKHALTVPKEWIEERDAAIRANKEKRISDLERQLAEVKAA